MELYVLCKLERDVHGTSRICLYGRTPFARCLRAAMSAKSGLRKVVCEKRVRADLRRGVWLSENKMRRAENSFFRNERMKKGQIIEGIVLRTDFPNKGIVETEEGVCMVKNALPGQKVRCAVSKVRSGRAEGRLLEVLAPAPSEVVSPCPHFGLCGSCVYLSLPYEEQLKIKEAQVKRLLDSALCKPCGAANEKAGVGTREEELCKLKTVSEKESDGGMELCKPKREKNGGANDLFEGIKASPTPFGYRNKMEFSFGDEVKDGPLALGMHKRGSFYDIVSVTDCRIVDEDYRNILQCALSYFDDLQKQGVELSYYHRLRHIGYLRHLLVRKAAKTGEILVALVTTTQNAFHKSANGQTAEETGTLAGGSQEGVRSARGIVSEESVLTGFRDRLLALPLTGKIVGILHTKNDSQADVVQSDETEVLYGQDFFYEELLGLKFRISQFSFFQTNSLGAEVLYETAREYIGKYIATKQRPKDGDSAKQADADGVTAKRKEIDAAAVTDEKSRRPAGDKQDKIVYDLYSGTGTIAQLMAPVAKKVIGVEIVEEAVEAARKNAELNGLHNCEFIAGDVLKVLDEIEEKPDIIILDPPRDGVHPKALKKILDYGVEHILYISCKPTSLVRDLETFLEHGYGVERAVAVDMFPWTSGVEVVCLLHHQKSTENFHVDYEPQNSDYLDKMLATATYREIK